MGCLWFKQKTYGWGWTPANWIGWVVVALDVMAVAAYPVYCEASGMEVNVPTFILLTIGWTVALIGVCVARGEKPEWRWGPKKEPH